MKLCTKHQFKNLFYVVLYLLKLCNKKITYVFSYKSSVCNDCINSEIFNSFINYLLIYDCPNS